MKRSLLSAVALALLTVPLFAQVTVGPNSGAASTPGNYPGSGSSPQKGLPPASSAPPPQDAGGVTNTPPSGLTPGSGAGGATNNVPAH